MRKAKQQWQSKGMEAKKARRLIREGGHRQCYAQ
jgi:hypothetical protein